jgi:hypothetical protein
MKLILCLRTFLLLGSFFFAMPTTYGQPPKRANDQIVRNDNRVIEAVISEVNETTIIYRRAAAPKGPVYRVSKTEINYIRYADGEVERFSRPAVASRPPIAPRQVEPEPQRTDYEPPRTEQEPQRVDPEPRRAAPPQRDPAPRRAESVSRFESAARSRFGLLLGIGGGSLSNGYFVATQSIGLTLRGGATAEIPISRRLAFSPSLEYLRLGWTTPTRAPFPASLNYVVATAAVNSLYDDSKPVNFYYSAGFYGAFGTSIPVDLNGQSESYSYDFFDISSFHLGVESRVGARFSHALTVYAQFNRGLTNMGTDTGAKNSLTQFTFGAGARYLFGN